MLNEIKALKTELEESVHHTQDALDQIIEILAKLRSGQAGVEGIEAVAEAEAGEMEKLARMARRLIALREVRQRFLPSGYFDEPAYNILLDLFVAHCENRVTYVHDACVASQSPMSTALRWVSVIVNDGFAIRHRDVVDGRRTILEITPKGVDAVRKVVSTTFKG